MSENEPIIQFRCSRCTGTVRVPASEAGKDVYCPACYQKLTVPAESQPDRRDVDPSLLYAVDNAPRDTREMTGSFGYFNYPCPLCRTEIAIRAEDVGKKIECPDCGTVIEVTSAWLDEKRREREANRLGAGRPAPSVGEEVVYQINPRLENNPRAPLWGIAPVQGDEEKVVSASENSASVKNASPSRPDYSDLVPVFCSLCGTLMYAKKSEIGRKIRCPDCETETLVTEPENNSGRLNSPIEPQFTGGYELASDTAVPARPVSDIIEPVFTGGYELAESPEDLKVPPFPNPILGEKTPPPAAERENPSRNSQNPQNKTLRALADLEKRMRAEESTSSSEDSQPPILPNTPPRLDSESSKPPKINLKAKKNHQRKNKSKKSRDLPQKGSSLASWEDPQAPESKVIDGRVVYVLPSLPKHPMGVGLFAPLADAGFWAHWVIPGVFGFFTYSAFDMFIRELITQRLISAPITTVFGLMAFCMLLLLWLMSLGYLFFATFTALAGGNKRMEGGFEADFTGGFFLSLKLFTILTASLLPGIILLKLDGVFFGRMGVEGLFTRFPAALWGLSVFPFVLFPFFFLSTLQLDYPFAPFSAAIFRTLKSRGSAWAGFFAWTLFLIGIPALLLALLPAGTIHFVTAGLAFTIVPALYAVVLGRLGWIIEDANREED